MIGELLAGLDGWYRRQSPAVWQRLRPAAEPAALAAVEAGLGQPLPGELRALYRWHDGAGTPPAAFYLTPDYAFIPSSWAVDFRRDKADAFAGACESGLWDPTWIPFGTSWCGDLLLLRPADGAVVPFIGSGGLMDHERWESLPAMLAEHQEALSGDGVWQGRRLDRATGEWESAE